MGVLRKILCILCIISACVCSSYAQVSNLYTISTTIEFTINTDNIIQNTNYHNYINKIVPIIEENKDNIDYILLIGSASPEGNYNANIKLANKRADKIYSYISNIVASSKIIKNNNYDLFLMKTGFDESDYTKLRATYIEIHFLKQIKDINYPIKKDTVYIEKKDTVYYNTTIENNYYIYQNKEQNYKPIFGIYNDIPSDLLLRANIGFELYFNQMSFFIEGSFSNWDLFGKIYNIDIWNTGFRKYFNYDYDKWFTGIYCNAGYFDTELFGDIGKVGFLYGGGLELGYTFSLKHNWKISPIIRIGLFERVYYADYYYSESGNINIIFGNYSNGKINGNNEQSQTQVENNKIMVNKVITKEFIENSNKAYYIGPTFIGLVLKKDFLLKTK
jgi:hypothetical protein